MRTQTPRRRPAPRMTGRDHQAMAGLAELYGGRRGRDSLNAMIEPAPKPRSRLTPDQRKSAQVARQVYGHGRQEMQAFLAVVDPHFVDRPPSVCAACWSDAIRKREQAPQVCAHKALEGIGGRRTH